MNPEDRLDHLLRRQPIDPGEISAREAEMLDAAADVEALRGIRVPSDFAARLETRLRARARELQSGAAQPPSLNGRHPRKGVFPPSARRIFIAAGSALALLLVMGIALFAASANSLPGDWLYGIKQLRNQIALSQAHTPADRARLSIQQLLDALGDLRAEVREGRGDSDILQALAVVHTQTHNAQAAVAAIPAGRERTQEQQALAAAIADEQSLLRNLLASAHWPVRVALTTQLGATGAVVPAISSVNVIFTGSGQAIITISGAHFASGALVLLDNAPLGQVQAFAPDHLILKLPANDLSPGSHVIGVQNPDGTAAAYGFTAGSPHNRSGARPTPEPAHTPNPPGNGNGNGHHGTPTPSGTPGKGNANGNGG